LIVCIITISYKINVENYLRFLAKRSSIGWFLELLGIKFKSITKCFFPPITIWVFARSSSLTKWLSLLIRIIKKLLLKIQIKFDFIKILLRYGEKAPPLINGGKLVLSVNYHLSSSWQLGIIFKQNGF